jgi:hypothetical protein
MSDRTSPMGSLFFQAAQLFLTAYGLPDPETVTVYGVLDGHVLDEISLHFASTQPGKDAITQWAAAFGSKITETPGSLGDDPVLYVRTEFPFRAATVSAFAVILLPEPEAIPHADYPHQPGTLYDCPACESSCHCTPGSAQCIYDGPHGPNADAMVSAFGGDGDA